MLCLKAHAKINWSLDILGTREDGYHLMDMLMQSVELHDTLWLKEADELSLEGVTVSGRTNEEGGALSSEVVTYDEKNLVYRAAQKLQERYHVKKGAHMRLEKRIPSGAGMGGGSADAAAALKGLCEPWQLDVPFDELKAIGLSLGADIPFMLTGGLARVGGIGEEIQPLSPAPEIWLVMLQPCEGLSTKEIFTAFDSLPADEMIHPRTDEAQKALLSSDMISLGASMDNVLEFVSAKARPAIREACCALEDAGAVRGMMTGSGSVVYGLFSMKAEAEKAVEALRPVANEKGWGDVWITCTRKA